MRSKEGLGSLSLEEESRSTGSSHLSSEVLKISSSTTFSMALGWDSLTSTCVGLHAHVDFFDIDVTW